MPGEPKVGAPPDSRSRGLRAKLRPVSTAFTGFLFILFLCSSTADSTVRPCFSPRDRGGE